LTETIYITKEDYDKLQRLIAARRHEFSSDRATLDQLEQELDRAEIVDPGSIPPDVITMNSEVRLKDLDSGDEMVYSLVFPNHARSGTAISVLAPIGTAMLGYRAGDVIRWRVPKGMRQLKVLNVLYQPEAVGVSGVNG
jgi:regulator of nucleoside diphosphate kinase